MKIKCFIISLIFTLLFYNWTIENASARMVFVKDEGATDSDVFVLDADDSNDSDVQLQFGQTLGKTLRWDNLNSQFTFNDNINIEGDISLTGTIDNIDISQLANDVATHTWSISNPHEVTLEQARTQNNVIEGNLDFNQNQAENLTIQNATTAPTNPVEGQIYFNTNDNKAYLWDGSSWQDMLDWGGTTSTENTIMPALQIRRTTDLNLINQNTWYDITFDTTDVESDRGALLHNTNNTERIEIGETGVYKITYQIDSLDESENHRLETRVMINGNTQMAGSFLVNYDYRGEHVPHSAILLGSLNAGDYITMQAQRLSDNTIINETTFTIVKLEALKGEKGERGEQWPIGLTWAIGPQWATGATGLQWPQGEKGPPGTLTGGIDNDKLTIDQDNTATNAILSFGSGATAWILNFDAGNNWFNLNERLNIGGEGLMDGIKITTTASATDDNQNQIEIRNNSNNPVFAVNEDGDVDIQGEVDFNQNWVQNFVFENLVSAPTNPISGQIYYNTSENANYFWNGNSWKKLLSGETELITMSAVQIRRTSSYTPSSTNIWYDLEFDTTDLETNSGAIAHDTTNTDNIKIYQAWLYQITYQVNSNNSSNTHQLDSRVRLNDTDVLNGSLLNNRNYRDEYTPTSATFLAQLNSGDSLTLQVMRTTENSVTEETTLTIVKLETGAQWSQGEQGEIWPAGADGKDGANGTGISDFERISETSNNNSNGTKTITVSCTGTKRIFAGGGQINETNENLSIHSSYPSSETEWTITATETDRYNGNWSITAWAICAEVTE